MHLSHIVNADHLRGDVLMVQVTFLVLANRNSCGAWGNPIGTWICLLEQGYLAHTDLYALGAAKYLHWHCACEGQEEEEGRGSWKPLVAAGRKKREERKSER